MVRYYENLKSLDSSFSENLDSLILEEKKTLIRVIKEIDLKQFKIEEKQKRYEKPLVSILFLLQIFGFYILILYSSYFDRTNKVNRVIAVENIPYRKKVRSYFCGYLKEFVPQNTSPSPEDINNAPSVADDDLDLPF